MNAAGKRLLVFGKTGQVARELARLRPDARFLDRAEADLTQPEACAAAIRAADCDAVINAAAWTAVDLAETEEATATVVNAAAPGAMAAACAERALLERASFAPDSQPTTVPLQVTLGGA